VPHARSTAALLAFGAAAAAVCAGFVALGSWQLERLAWKLELMQRVTERVHAPASAAPGPAQWPRIDAAHDEYRHVRASGRYLYGRQTYVRAATELGGGYWVLTPLQQDDGTVVLVNRGFVPPEQRARAAGGPEDGGALTVTGLLRLSEPGGSFLRRNDAPAERWYSRDLPAIAAARGLAVVAPYFIDADASGSADTFGPAPKPAPSADGAPVGGLTVIRFHNNHLVYAITWFALALMVALAGAALLRMELRFRRAARLGSGAAQRPS
jgi:surfeit locus 1 family protein